MRNRISSLLATVVLGLSLSGCATDERMDSARTLDEDKGLAELRQKLMAAYQSGDASQLAQLFTDNAVLIPSAGQEIKGRQNIEQTFRTLWQNWKVVDFNLVPQEGKTTGDWAFERGTITLQAAKLNQGQGDETRPAAARGQGENQAGSTASGQATGDQSNKQQSQQGQAGAQPGQQAGSGTPGSGTSPDQVVMDLNYYVMVLNKVDNDWRINWFVSTNPPEYVDTVTSDQQQSTGARGRQRPAPTRSERSAE